MAHDGREVHFQGGLVMLKNLVSAMATLAVFCLLLPSNRISFADERIAFDVANALDVRDVTTAEFGSLSARKADSDHGECIAFCFA